MSHLMWGVLSLGLLLLLLFLRVHVGIALGITGFLAFYLITGDFYIALGLLTTTPYKTAANYALTAVPLFILMGHFAGHAGIAEATYRAANKWVGKFPGGLAMTTVVSNAAFGAVCGSSVAATAIFTKFSLPEMERHGYDTYFAGATIASAGLLAMLIPPSVNFIVYGILAEQSIGTLFIAGIIPGLLLTALYCIQIYIMARFNPKIVGGGRTITFTWKERLLSLRELWAFLILVVIVIGGIYGGIFSPTEAGAVGAFSTLVIALAMRKLRWVDLRQDLLSTARTTGMLFLIIIGATIYSKLLAISGVGPSFVTWVKGLDVPPLVIHLMFMLMYLLLGCILDSISMLTITLPLILPVTVALGWNPVWFAMTVCMAVEIGLVTPPLGLNIFTVKAVAGPKVTLEGLIHAVIPFFFVMLAALALIIAFPPISTWLPRLMHF